jgi:thiol-disulfide isomerase/thioredoxin
MILCLLGLLVLAGLHAGPVGTEFEARVWNTESEADALPLIQEYLPKMQDISDFRTLQNYWMEADKAACQKWFEDKHKAEPDSEMFHYLYLRTQEDKVLQLEGARALISSSPDYYWGYRLFTATYAQMLNSIAVGDSLPPYLASYIEQDGMLLQYALIRFPGDDYVALALYHHFNHQDNQPEAEKYLCMIRDPEAIRTNYPVVMEFCERSGRTAAFETLFPILLGSVIQKGQLQSADSLRVYQDNYVRVLESARLWDELESYLAANPALQESPSTLDIRISLAVQRDRPKEAIRLVERALADDVLHITDLDSERFARLAELPEWKKAVHDAKAKHEQQKPERRKKAIAKRIDKPAPLWELPDADGNIVKLADLKGKILILDFWATWCNPCRQTMPVLDNWMRQSMPKGVQVYSINVWERDPEAARKLMSDQNYAMKLLFAPNSISKDYGFDGIPYLCVIDQDGRIVFAESGYSRDLDEKLSFWIDALIK